MTAASRSSSKTSIDINIEPDDDSGLHIASMILDGERYIISTMPIAVQQMDETVFENFHAFCISIAKTIALSRGLIILSYSIRFIDI